jgi:transcriptional regulator with XRE-family HTH domain
MNGEDLKLWRQKRGVTQAELAKMLGTHAVTVCRWETGVRGIPFLLPLALDALESQLRDTEKGG